jgi:rhomboid protease GluP
MDSRRMCPHCRAFITNKDRVCPYCNERVGERAVDRRSPGAVLGGLIPHAQFVTTTLLTVNVGMYLLSAVYSMRSGNSQALMSLDGRTLTLLGETRPDFLHEYGEWWRLVTAGYLHGGLLHILGNMWVLLQVGSQVEELYGSARMFVYYTVASVCGFYLSSAILGHFTVGASAGITGLLGVMIAWGMQRGDAIGEYIKGQYLIWVVYILASGFMFPAVDNAAHIGGLVAGFAIAWVTGTPRYEGSPVERVWKVAGLLCLLLTGICLLEAFLFFVKYTQ